MTLQVATIYNEKICDKSILGRTHQSPVTHFTREILDQLNQVPQPHLRVKTTNNTKLIQEGIQALTVTHRPPQNHHRPPNTRQNRQQQQPSVQEPRQNRYPPNQHRQNQPNFGAQRGSFHRPPPQNRGRATQGRRGYSGQNRGQGGYDQQTKRCFNCTGLGHFRNACPTQRPTQ